MKPAWFLPSVLLLVSAVGCYDYATPALSPEELRTTLVDWDEVNMNNEAVVELEQARINDQLPSNLFLKEDEGAPTWITFTNLYTEQAPPEQPVILRWKGEKQCITPNSLFECWETKPEIINQ